MAQKVVTFRHVNRPIRQIVTSRHVNRRIHPVTTPSNRSIAQRHELKQILARAVEVFGDESEARLWLKEPKSALQGMTPIQAIKTASGVQQVELMLGRIEHGIFV